MRRTLAAAVAVLAAAAIPPVTAAPAGPGFTSPGVEWITTVPVDAGLATGARIVGDRLYVAGSKSFSIYDVKDRLAPKLLSVTPIGAMFPNEDVDTNGEILLVNDEQLASGELQVWDVRDPVAPRKLATMPNMRDHTFSCVLDCTFAYGSRGLIVDLRDPANPKRAGRWAELPRTDAYDVTEVAPGIVLTATRRIRLLDARNPLEPRELATATTPDHRLIHSIRWPRGGADRWILVQGETPLTGRCTEDSGAIMTFDTRGWRSDKKFDLTDAHRAVNGTYADGNPAAGVLGCTAMWFHQHPSFRDGGLVAAAYFEHGIRFLRVDRAGRISEAGHFVPFVGASIAVYWAAPDIVYALDTERGIDVLKVTKPVR